MNVVLPTREMHRTVIQQVGVNAHGRSWTRAAISLHNQGHARKQASKQALTHHLGALIISILIPSEKAQNLVAAAGIYHGNKRPHQLAFDRL